LSILGGHWKPIIIWYLGRDHSLRFKELLALMPDISSRVLTEVLKELEEDEIISRQSFNETPPRVEYSLTKYGATIIPALAGLREWGLKHLKKNKKILHPDSEWNQKLK
jgi:DNA-binding HxlR family transcriptional regulator